MFGACNNLGLEDERADCDTVNVAVRFSYTPGGGDNIVEQVGDVRMLVFDSLNVMAAELRFSREQVASGNLNVGLPEGRYTFVVWAVDGDDLNSDGYDIEALPGETRLEDLQLRMADPEEAYFDDLYYASAYDVEIVRGVPLVVPMEFIRQSHIVRVMIEGIDYAPTRATAPLNVYVEGKNGMFDYRGSIAPNAGEALFSTTEYSEADGVGTFDVKILRLEMDYHTQNPMTLHVETLDGTDVVPPMDIVQTLLLSPDYNTQEDFDLIYEYSIELRIDPVTLDVTVWINDYQIVPVTAAPLEPLE